MAEMPTCFLFVTPLLMGIVLSHSETGSCYLDTSPSDVSLISDLLWSARVFSAQFFCQLGPALSIYSSGNVSCLCDLATVPLLGCHTAFHLFTSQVSICTKRLTMRRKQEQQGQLRTVPQMLRGCIIS